MKKLKVLCCGSGRRDISNVIIGNNNTIICNGQDISNSFDDMLLEQKKFDKTFEKDINSYNEKINTIIIKNSCIDVSIRHSKSSNVKVKLEGTARMLPKDNMDVELSQTGTILTISINSFKHLSNSNLLLKVEIPDIENLNVYSTSADIVINKSVTADCVCCESSSGDIEAILKSSFARLKSTSGDLLISAIGITDAHYICSSTSGDIDLELCNFNKANITTNNLSGMVGNSFKSDPYGKSSVKVCLETTSGDITIKSSKSTTI